MTSARDPTSLAWVAERQPRRLSRLFEGLDLERPELAAVKAAAATGDWVAAGTALLDYYRTGASGQWLRHDPVPPGDGTDPVAEKAAHAIFPMPGLDVQIPRLPSGGLNWAYVPPENGGEEWVFGINRHDYLADVLAAFFATGNRAYARCLDAQLRDWCGGVERPESDEHIQPCPWGTILEVGHRAKAWPAVFYGLQREDAFSPAARILLLSQALDHARFLRARHTGGSNWVLTEMSGLLSVACAWPEFREAAEWRQRALQVAPAELEKQVYPDGTLKELTSNYQLAVLGHLGFFVDTVRGAGLPPDPGLTASLERMWNYLAYSLGPNGHPPHNSDSDRCQAEQSQIIKPLVAAQPLRCAADAYHRPDWSFIATNGARGTRPPGLPSILFPWAGQLIMRSGWEADAHWAFFDLGPWGTLHQHFDALHLSVTAHGRDLLVDSGRYTYANYWGEPGTWRHYFISSQAHNVILVDGLGQQDGPRVAEHPLADDQVRLTADYDYAQGTFAGGFTDAATVSARLKAITFGRPSIPEGATGAERGVLHTRAVLYLRGLGWLVVDRITTDRPRRLTPLWHFHPACTVVREGQSVVTVDAGVGNLRLVPLGPTRWDLELVRGREGPDFQGWYSSAMDVREPDTCVCYGATIPHTTTMAWLLLPARGPVPEPRVTELAAPAGAVHLRLEGLAARPLEVAVRLDDAAPLELLDGQPLAGPCAVHAAR